MAIDPFELTGALQRRMETFGLEFLAEFYERHTLRAPDDVDILIELGHLLTRLERYEQGLTVDRRLADLLPTEPTVHYNLACSLALVGRIDEAFAALDRAVERGYDDVAFLREDDDLAPLRSDPRFAELIERLGG